METAPRTGGPVESWMWLEVLSAANSVTSDRMSEDRLGTALSRRSRNFSVTGRGKGATACDRQAHQCFHRRPICQGPRFLLRPPSLCSPSRCPRPGRCSPGKRTSSCRHTWGSVLSHFRNPNYLRRAETHFRGGATTRASGEAPPPPRRQPALRRR